MSERNLSYTSHEADGSDLVLGVIFCEKNTFCTSISRASPFLTTGYV
jgi:hypothetical protein